MKRLTGLEHAGEALSKDNFSSLIPPAALCGKRIALLLVKEILPMISNDPVRKAELFKTKAARSGNRFSSLPFLS